MLPTSFRVTVLSASTPASPPGPGSGTALVTKMRSPQTTGLEWPRPGIGVFQATFVPAATSQVSGGWPAASTPLASGPRNEGQRWASAAAGTAEERGAEQDGGDGPGIEVCGACGHDGPAAAPPQSNQGERPVPPGEPLRHARGRTLPMLLPMLLPT